VTSMSANVVVKRGSFAVEPISWPAAQEHVWTSSGQRGEAEEERRGPEETVRQNSELAALRRELAEVREAADRRVEEAMERGRAEGQASARVALSQQFETEMGRAATLMDGLIAAGPKLRRGAEEDMVRLAVAIARRVLHREITVDSDAILGLVKAAFARVDQREVVQVRTDAALMGAMQRILQSLDPARKVNLVVDAALQPGSLILETTRGQLDASVETQLEEIQRGFTDFVHGHGKRVRRAK
jgi:flagellar assembly protein FliH